MTKPFLKWVGGKTQILDTVIGFFPKTLANYHEPFVGGGSVLLELLSKINTSQITISGTIYASDVNPWLIYTYQNIQKHLEQLLTELALLQNAYEASYHEEPRPIERSPASLEEATQHPENYYYWIRKQFNEMCLQKDNHTSCKLSAMFIFLNKTGFRGIYREGPNGYNVPYGHYKNLKFYDEHHLREVSQLIQPVHFQVQSFEHAWNSMKSGDFVYLDPPYAPEKCTSFVGYTANGFSMEMHDALFAKTKNLVKQDIEFLMSNADVPMVRDAFPLVQFDRRIIVCRRAIHSKDPSSLTNELLIQAK